MSKGNSKADTLRGILAEGQWLCRLSTFHLWEFTDAKLRRVAKEALEFTGHDWKKAGPLNDQILVDVLLDVGECNINLKTIFRELKKGGHTESPDPITMHFSVNLEKNGTINSVHPVRSRGRYKDVFFVRVYEIFQRLQGSPYRLRWCTREDCQKPFFAKGNQGLCGDVCRKANASENVKEWRAKNPAKVSKYYEKRVRRETGNPKAKVQPRPRKG